MNEKKVRKKMKKKRKGRESEKEGKLGKTATASVGIFCSSFLLLLQDTQIYIILFEKVSERERERERKKTGDRKSCWRKEKTISRERSPSFDQLSCVNKFARFTICA